MASCAMRGMRYISFPPIVFETPAPAPATEAPILEPQQEPSPPEAVAPMPVAPLAVTPAPATPELGIPVLASPVVSPTVHEAAPPAAPSAAPPAAPPAAMRRLAESLQSPEQPALAPASGRLRRLSELAATESLVAGDAETRPRYALLNDIAVELRPRRQRARTGQGPTTGQGQTRLKPNPTAPPWP